MSVILKQRGFRTAQASLSALKKMEWEKLSPALNSCVHCAKQPFMKLENEHNTLLSSQNLDLESMAQECLTPNPKTMWIVCIDERIQYFASSHRALSIGLPGSECLVSKIEQESIAKHLITSCKQMSSIEEIIVTSHSKCGAVNKALCSHNKNTLEKRVNKLLAGNNRFCDEIAKSYATEFAGKLGNIAMEEDLDVSIRTLHLDHEQLHCSAFHNAVGAVINSVPNLNVSEFEEKLDLPLFNIYSLGQPASLVKANIELAIEIAAQKCGLGKYFDEQNPFVLIFTGVDEKTEGIIKELSTLKTKIPVAFSICNI